MKPLIIINPISGKGKPKIHARIVRAIHKHFSNAGFEYEIVIWEHPDHIVELLAHAHDGGFDTVIAAGGDGTINEVARRLVGTEIALGIIPIGSGNGFARHLGYSREPKRAVKQLVEARRLHADSGIFGGVPFMNNAGIGIDAEVAKRYSRAGSRGLKTYMQMGVRTFFGFKSFDCKLEVDGVAYEVKSAMLMDITNGTQWGGGAMIAPESEIADGFLEAVIVEKTPLMEVPRMLGMLFDGTIHRHPRVKIIKGRKFRIERLTPGNAHVDGESIKMGKSIECEINEKSLHLLIPRKKKKV